MKCLDCSIHKGKTPVVRCGGVVKLVCNICRVGWAEFMPSLKEDK